MYNSCGKIKSAVALYLGHRHHMLKELTASVCCTADCTVVFLWRDYGSRGGVHSMPFSAFLFSFDTS